MDIKQLNADDVCKFAEQFAQILLETVAGDGAVGFVMPLSEGAAKDFWIKTIAPQLMSGERVLFAAFIDENLAGTGQLIVGMPNNQPHRAEISKLMVHPNHRRKGIARALMMRLEQTAIERNRTLITLDTRTDDGGMPLYISMGYEIAGVIPNYAKNAVTEGFHSTTYMFKQVG